MPVFVDLGNLVSHTDVLFYQMKITYLTIFPILHWLPEISELHLILIYNKYINIDFSYIYISIYHIHVYIRFFFYLYIFIYYISMGL